MEIGGWLAKRQPLSATLLLVLALHICFFPFIWGNQTLLTASRGPIPSIMPNGAGYGGSQGPSFSRGNDMGASGWLLEPDAALVHHEYLHERHLPLWNPYQSYGAPLAANMQSQPFNPLFVLFSMAPGPRAYNLFVLARFLLAGLCTYLYLRLFLPFVPAIAGGIACMLSGYFVLFFDMPELSVNILVPALFLAAERLLREQRTANVILSSAVTCLCILGGMPESAFLVLGFGGAYFLFRLAVVPAARAVRMARLKYFLFAQGVGLALAAFLLVPFFEFLKLSFDSHQPVNLHGYLVGLRYDVFGSSLFTYVIPTLFGPAWHAIGPGLGGYDSLRGYMGVVQVLFAIVAVGGLARRGSLFPGEKRLTLFFLASAALIVLKRYGAPIVNSIGRLPFCELIWFPKYDEPLLAFALAVLCACGMHQVLSNTVSRRRLVISVLIVFAVLISALAFSLFPVLAAKAAPHEYYMSLVGAGGVLFVTALVLIGPSRPGSGRWLPATLVILLAAEMAGNYIYPVYYFLTSSAADEADPYRGAPYIDYLKAGIAAQERVFGREGILHPDWAGSFQLADIRGLDAMYYRKYFDFIRFFLREEIPPDARGDLVNRFTGFRWLPVDSPLKRRLLQLSSVKFLLSLQPYGQQSGRAQEIVRQNEGRLLPGKENLIEVRTFTISGETKAVLFEHPPYERLPFKTTLTPASREFSFSVAMQPAVYDGSMPLCGDGVEFRLEIRDSTGRIRPLYSRYIDPKHSLAERRWIPGSVDLSEYLGQTVELLFTTTAGPKGDTCAAWAGWGDPHFNGDITAQPAFRQVYDHEIKIYETPDYLPRAALFSSAELALDDAAALTRLGSSGLDIFQTAVVSATDLEPADLAAIASLNSLPPGRVRAAKIVSYASQEVAIDAIVERPALLVLNDSDYPGWKVYVDGRRAHGITANYLFRGVLLKPGRHLVQWAYEPVSFAAGAAISGGALICLAGFAWWRRGRSISGVAEAHFV
jgi:hypothetical protein